MRKCLSKSFLEIFTLCALHANVNMESLPAHQPLLEDDTDEELSDQQIKELLNEAAERMRAKAALQPSAAPEVPFKLPKLRPGHIADTYEKTEGNITRLDHSKLIDKKQLALANSIKKIDDPIADKRKRKEVCTSFFSSPHSRMPVMIIIPNFFPDADSGSVLDAFLHHLMVFIHSYTEAQHTSFTVHDYHACAHADRINRRSWLLLVPRGSTCLRPISLQSLSVTCSC